MKFCQKCGSQIDDEAVICISCGCQVAPKSQQQDSSGDDGLTVAIKIFMILGCIAQGILIIPLAWLLPITKSVFGKIKRGESIGTGLKICVLLFVNLIAGILLLCRSDAR